MMNPSRPSVLSALSRLRVALLVALASAASTADPIHVAPGGDDAGDGSVAQPLRSLARAQAVARQRIAAGLDGDLHVVLAAGTWHLVETLRFAPEDGGNGTHAVRWYALEGQTALLSGGRRIDGWRVGNGIWVADLPAVRGAPWSFRQLFVNGRRATRARFPNEDAAQPYVAIAGCTYAADGSSCTVRLPPRTVEAWGDPARVELAWLGQWTINRQRIASHDAVAGTVTIAAPLIHDRSRLLGYAQPQPFQNMPKRWGWAENAVELLDAPGEWHLDERVGMLRYRPMPGETPSTAVVIAPVVEDHLLLIEGTPDRPVRNLRFANLDIAHVEWRLPASGFIGRQASGHFLPQPASAPLAIGATPAAVQFQYAHGCTFSDGAVSQVGGDGIGLRRGCRGAVIYQNHVHDVGGSGIHVGEQDWQSRYYQRGLTDAKAMQARDLPAPAGWGSVVPPEEDLLRDITIDANEVERCGRLDYGAVGIATALVDGALVLRNHVHHLPYSGISVGLCWRPWPTCNRATEVAHNHVHHVMERLCDGAGIYALGDHQEGRIHRNLVHGLARSPWANNRANNPAPVSALYLDDGAHGLVISGNVFVGSLHSKAQGAELDANDPPAGGFPEPRADAWVRFAGNIIAADENDARFKALLRHVGPGGVSDGTE